MLSDSVCKKNIQLNLYKMFQLSKIQHLKCSFTLYTFRSIFINEYIMRDFKKKIKYNLILILRNESRLNT